MRKFLDDRNKTVGATLFVRGEGTSMHGNFKLIYDDYFDITWHDYVVEGFSNDRSDPDPNALDDTTWSTQMAWADNLSVDFNGRTFDDWRLPSACNHDFTEPSFENDIDSEMGNLNKEIHNGYWDINGNWQKGSPFLSSFQDWFWTGTEDPRPNAETVAIIYNFKLHEHNRQGKESSAFSSIAVRSGDVSARPGDVSTLNPPKDLRAVT